MNKTIDQLDKWHHTKPGLITFGLVELVLVYLFVSLALGSGSLWWYLLALVFLAGGLQNLFKLIGKIRSGGQQTN